MRFAKQIPRHSFNPSELYLKRSAEPGFPALLPSPRFLFPQNAGAGALAVPELWLCRLPELLVPLGSVPQAGGFYPGGALPLWEGHGEPDSSLRAHPAAV